MYLTLLVDGSNVVNLMFIVKFVFIMLEYYKILNDESELIDTHDSSRHKATIIPNYYYIKVS